MPDGKNPFDPSREPLVARRQIVVERLRSDPSGGHTTGDGLAPFVDYVGLNRVSRLRFLRRSGDGVEPATSSLGRRH